MSKKEKAPKLLIASFAFGGNIPIQCATSIFATVADLNAHGIDTSIDIRPGGPYVQKERNLSVARFLQTDCTHMLFIDADLAFDPTSARKMLMKNKDIIGGLYRYKMDKECYPVQLLVHDSGEKRGEYYGEDDCFLAAGLPTGFMMIRREVIELMIQNYPETRFELRESDTKEVIMNLYNLFDCVLHEGKWWGEDYVFCKRWLALGGELWAYTDFPCAHIGTFGYIGDFKSFYNNNKADHVARNIADLDSKEAPCITE